MVSGSCYYTSEWQRHICEIVMFSLASVCSMFGLPDLQTSFLTCIECMRCSLFLPMFAASVCQPVCHAAHLGWTDAVWGEYFWGPMKQCVRRGSWCYCADGLTSQEHSIWKYQRKYQVRTRLDYAKPKLCLYRGGHHRRTDGTGWSIYASFANSRVWGIKIKVGKRVKIV